MVRRPICILYLIILNYLYGIKFKTANLSTEVLFTDHL